MLTSSIGKKYMMALSGTVLVGFVFIHMAGNLQMFAGQEKINAYAHFLKSLPPFVLWGSRIFLLLAVIVHAWTAAKLCSENRNARPDSNQIETTKSAGFDSLKMGLTGSVLLAFIVFHILHYTTQSIYPEYQEYMTSAGAPDGEKVPDVHRMVIAGFGIEWIAFAYIICMFLLCRHLTHGVSSMFQTLGLRSESWRPKLDCFASLYGWIIFIGFISVPLAVVLQKHGAIEPFDPNLFDQAIPAAISSTEAGGVDE